MAEQIFDMPVRIGFPRGVSGKVEEIDSPRCTTAVGLLLYGSQAVRGKTRASARVVEKLRKIFKNLV
jgi:cell division protein FtsA